MWIPLGAIFMFLAVALGAFGAHGLKTRLSPDMLAVFEVGVKYHITHALGLFVVAWLSDRNMNSLITAAGWFFVMGIIVFSGSLYALSLTGIRWLGAITPIGGICFLAGWACIACGYLRHAK